MSQRAVGLIVTSDKILLIHRLKFGREYYVFPGGQVEPGETVDQALIREIAEETGLRVLDYHLAFEVDFRGKREVYFVVTRFAGTLAVGGPEKERMSEQNQYLLEWFKIYDLKRLAGLEPRSVIDQLFDWYQEYNKSLKV